MTTVVRNVPTGSRAKSLGAYYTPDTAVNFMIRWAVRQPNFNVIDPSFGDGVFLKHSKTRVDKPQEQIYGIEFDELTFNTNKDNLTTQHQLNIKNLWNGDFFDSEGFFQDRLGTGNPVRRFDAVVGNPPFIRYQKFKGSDRARALQRALELDVELPGHVSSWAPFLVHAVSLIKPGGRLAMVAPAELGHAGYARNVLWFLTRQFANLSILTFRKRLFPKLSEDTFIILGEGREAPTTCFELVDVASEADLKHYTEAEGVASIGDVRQLSEADVKALGRGEVRLLEFFLPPDVRAFYQQLERHPRVKPFGQTARIGIGYVTGNNDFFHLSQGEVDAFGIPDAYLTPCVRRSSNLSGLSLTVQDWSSLEESKKWLLNIPPRQDFNGLPAGLRNYLLTGEARGVHDGFKVKRRNPWYSVPHVKRGAALLTYMSGSGPRLVHNVLGAPAPNTLHTVELPESVYKDDRSRQRDEKLLVVSWYTSLTFLSAELEGHSLGGGMLKLEPGEARKVLMALPDNLEAERLDRAYREIDSALRRQDLEAALDIGDAFILRQGLDYSLEWCLKLRSGYHYLRDRRTSR